MFYIFKRRFFSRFAGILLTLLLVSQIPVSGQVAFLAEDNAVSGGMTMEQAAPPVQAGPAAPGAATAVNCSSTTCPAGPADLPYCVERTDFCVYYTTDSVTDAEATWAADQVQAYWNRFVALSFNEPKHSGKLQVRLLDIPGSCNGATGWSSNYITTYAGCFDLGDLVTQFVLGHELNHRVQYNYDTSASAPLQTKFLKEGTARALQDNWFTEIDHMPAGAASFTYCAEAASYLASTNTDLSDLWYKSCVWWKWASERYGTTLTEPERGVDFIEAVYDQNTAGHSELTSVNLALNSKAPGTDFDDSFTKFAVAIYTKDLTGLPDDSYNIIDEDEVDSPGTCGSVAPASGGTIQVGTPATWNNQAVSKYGARYYTANIGANCPAISASFHRDSGPAFYHIVTQDGSAFKTHKQGSGDNWAQSFLNDGVTKVVAVVGSTNNSSQVDVTLECVDPDLDIKLPNTGAKAQVQSNTKFLAQVLVTNGSPTGPVVAGLTNSDFSAKVGGINAAVTGGGFIQEQYWLVIRAPAGLADGAYDLEVALEEPSTSTVIVTDTEVQSVVYTTDLVDHVLVLDRSGSMGYPTDAKLNAAKDAADFYVDITRNNDGLAVVPYNQDVNPAPFNMQIVNATVRNNAKTYIGGITASGSTSIGDGLDEAANQRTVVSPTGNPLCSFVLLSDGMENTPQYWSNVITDVVATGCPVTTIAFGPASNETLMQNIASATGGIFFYNDVYVSATTQQVTTTTAASMTLDLANTYEYAQGRDEGRQRLLVETGQVTYNISRTHEVTIDNSISEALFALDWYEQSMQSFVELELELVKPDGSRIDHSETLSYTFPFTYSLDLHTTHVGWRIPNPEPGKWKMVVKHISSKEPVVPYQVLVSGQSSLTLDLLLPDRLGRRFFTGNRFPIYAILSNLGPITNVPILATITAPDCDPNRRETMLPLFDDGEHGDGAAGDGVYANTYTRVNCAKDVPPEGEVGNPPAQDEGGYRVRLQARSAAFQREALGSFSVLEGEDTNGNNIPDTWETENGVTDANGDPDIDGLSNGDEYLAGTDPNNSDTDGGGENDKSEVDWGLDPLDPSDDEIEAPGFFQVTPLDGATRLTYDIQEEYVKMELWRAELPTKTWNLQVSELPLKEWSGVYTDVASNDTAWVYRLIAEDGAVSKAPGHRSAVLDSEAAMPSMDPVPPQAFVVINDGDASTRSRAATLSFTPYEYEPGDPDGFADITHMMLSNDPTFTGAQWQTFTQDIPWQLAAQPGALAFVYARFRDEHGNVSVGTEADAILYDPHTIYLPVVIRNS